MLVMVIIDMEVKVQKVSEAASKADGTLMDRQYIFTILPHNLLLLVGFSFFI